MDGRDFDNWARRLARLRSRRDVLKAGIGAAFAGGVLAGRGFTPANVAAQTVEDPDPTCTGGDACTGSTACPGDLAGCSCATLTSGGGVCRVTASDCAAPVPCDVDADCTGPDQYCVVVDGCCEQTGFAGVCTTRCPSSPPITTTTTTTTEAPTTTTTTTAAATTTTTTTAAATTTTTTTAAATTTTTTTTAAPTTTTTTTAAPTTTTTTTTTPPPGITVDPVRGTVGSTFDFTIVSFPPSAQVGLLFIGIGGVNVDLGPATTDATGRATGTRTVPTVIGGEKEVRAFSGSEVETTPFEVAPRVRITPESVQPGQSVAAAVTGFGPAEFVRIRWRVGTTFVQVGTLTTGINGSGTVNVIVPANAPAGATAVRADGTAFAAQTNAVTVVIPQPPAVTIEPTRGTVNSDVDYTVANFPANAAGTIVWRRISGSTIDIGTFQTDGTGAATGSFPVPATPGGAGQVITFASGSVSKTATYEVAPRIKVATGAVGQAVDVSLRGFGRVESVRIRWLINGSWVQVSQVTTSNTGSANINVTIPAGAVVGANSVRGDGTTFRAQTNVAQVVAS